jgi:hypothetical protein
MNGLSPSPLTVVLLDGDAPTRVLVEAVVRQLGGVFTMTLPALETGPMLVLSHWPEGFHSARALVERSGSKATQLLALITEGGSGACVAAMQSGANDVLVRPLSARTLAAQLTVADQRARAGAGVSSTLEQALLEGLASQQGGELVVRSGLVVGTIQLQEGAIVWANLSSVPATLHEVMGDLAKRLDGAELERCLEESRRTRSHFVDIAIAWGLVSADEGRAAVRRFVSDRIRQLFSLPDARALFLPRVRRHVGTLRFSLEEVTEPSRFESLTAPPLGLQSAQVDSRSPPADAPSNFPDITGLLSEASALQGAVYAAAIDVGTASRFASWGDEPDAEIVWAQLGLCLALGEGAEDVFAMTSERCFVLRQVPDIPGVVLFVSFDRERASVGFARVQVQRLLALATSLLALLGCPHEGELSSPGSCCSSTIGR